VGRVGRRVGMSVGSLVGLVVGIPVGAVGMIVGESVGTVVGISVGPVWRARATKGRIGRHQSLCGASLCLSVSLSLVSLGGRERVCLSMRCKSRRASPWGVGTADRWGVWSAAGWALWWAPWGRWWGCRSGGAWGGRTVSSELPRPACQLPPLCKPVVVVVRRDGLTVGSLVGQNDGVWVGRSVGMVVGAVEREHNAISSARHFTISALISSTTRVGNATRREGAMRCRKTYRTAGRWVPSWAQSTRSR
jgi:hypothetical protein